MHTGTNSLPPTMPTCTQMPPFEHTPSGQNGSQLPVALPVAVGKQYKPAAQVACPAINVHVLP
jgi:hypothetical protein